MSNPTPNTPGCNALRAVGTGVAQATNRLFETWPQNVSFTAPMTFNPSTLAELANAVLQAEAAEHHVRAYGSKWSKAAPGVHERLNAIGCG
jgi:hypothetical protein